MDEIRKPKGVEQFKFSFIVSNEYLEPFTHFILFDGYNHVLVEGYGNILVDLEKGLYRLRIEINEHFEERTYRIDEDISDTLIDIRTSSTIPLDGLLSSNRKLNQAARRCSLKSTTNKLSIYSGALFLFVHYSDAESSKLSSDLERGFSILSSERALLFALNKSNVKEDHSRDGEHHFGWISFNVRLRQGQYYLVYTDNPGFEIPVFVFNDWQTQVFLRADLKPRFTSLRISMEKSVLGFRPGNKHHLELEALVQKMYNGIYYLPPKLIEEATDGALENPILGFVICYISLLSRNPEYHGIFKVVFAQLQRQILQNSTAPDMIALQQLESAILNRGAPPNIPFDTPCMFYEGMNIARSQTNTVSQLVETTPSNMELTHRHLISDGIWAVYKPLAINIRVDEENVPPIKKLAGIIRSLREDRSNNLEWKIDFKEALTNLMNQLAISESDWECLFTSLKEAIPYLERAPELLDFTQGVATELLRRGNLEKQLRILWPLLIDDVLHSRETLYGATMSHIRQANITLDKVPRNICVAIYEMDTQPINAYPLNNSLEVLLDGIEERNRDEHQYAWENFTVI